MLWSVSRVAAMLRLRLWRELGGIIHLSGREMITRWLRWILIQIKYVFYELDLNLRMFKKIVAGNHSYLLEKCNLKRKLIDAE